MSHGVLLRYLMVHAVFMCVLVCTCGFGRRWTKFPIQGHAVLLKLLMTEGSLGEVGRQSTYFALNRIRLQSVYGLIRDAENAVCPIDDRGVLFRYLDIAWWEFIFSVY